MPRLIYGTAWKAERTAQRVVQAVKTGFRGIDTAAQPKHYNEQGVGEALQELREFGIERHQLFIQTKFSPVGGQDLTRIPYNPHAALAVQVQESFANSLKNLKTDSVDSLVLHSPLAHWQETLEVWSAMEGIYRQGGTKMLGISNCYDLDLLIALHTQTEVKPAVVQNRFYPTTHYDVTLRRWSQNRGIAYQSFWTLTANPHLLESREIFGIAQAYGKTPAQILFCFLKQIGISPLTGTCSEKHMKEDLEILHFNLLDSEISTLNNLIN
mgnify:CR=1 FL=1